jgi:chromosome segregation ATPase
VLSNRLKAYTDITMGGNTTNDDTSHYEGALLEDILDRVKAIAKGQTSLWDKVDSLEHKVDNLEVKVDKIDQRLIKVEENTELLPAMQAAISNMSLDIDDHERQLKKHDRRIALLEESST